jgi:hypothetical protein
VISDKDKKMEDFLNRLGLAAEQPTTSPTQPAGPELGNRFQAPTASTETSARWHPASHIIHSSNWESSSVDQRGMEFLTIGLTKDSVF